MPVGVLGASFGRFEKPAFSSTALDSSDELKEQLVQNITSTERLREATGKYKKCFMQLECMPKKETMQDCNCTILSLFFS